MADSPSLRGLPLRALRLGLRTASRAGGTVVDRVLRGSEPPPFAPNATPTNGRTTNDPRDAVTILVGGQSVVARRGATVLEVATLAGIDLRSYCGGNCSCGTCRIDVRSGAAHLSRRGPMEEVVLGSEAAARGDRLACQAAVFGPVEVVIPEWF